VGADISYLRSWEGFVYLAVMVDAFNREVVGWAIADHRTRQRRRPSGGQPQAPESPRLEDPGRGPRRATTVAPPSRCCNDRLSPGCTRPTSSARRCSPPGFWPRWDGSGRRWCPPDGGHFTVDRLPSIRAAGGPTARAPPHRRHPGCSGPVPPQGAHAPARSPLPRRRAALPAPHIRVTRASQGSETGYWPAQTR
jgi:hypothetical protein